MLNLKMAALRYTVGDGDGLRKIAADRLPQIALAGRSNVGKSSLLNTVIGRKSLARVSGTPGKTVTVNFYAVPEHGRSNIGANAAVYLVDLPGYGYARRTPEEKERFRALTDGYFEGGEMNVALVLQLIDLGVGPTADDRLMLDYLTRRGLPFAVVATKADRPNKTERERAMDFLTSDGGVPKGTSVIAFSSRTGEGMTAIAAAINNAFERSKKQIKE